MRNKPLLWTSSIFLLAFLFQPLAMTGMQNIRKLDETERRRFTADYTKARKYYLEGKKYMRKEQLDKAYEKFLKSVETNSTFAESYVEIGNIYMKKSMYDEAIEEYNKGVNAYLKLEAYVAEGILKETASRREYDVYARDLYRDLYSQKFTIPPKIYLFLGSAYFRKGMIKEALEQFEKALEINPDYGEAHNNLAVIYFLSHQYDMAWRHMRLAEKFGAKVNPKFVEDLKKASPEPEKNN